jgi:serine phosphatase RsbU (regulator of sigma subunit)
VVADADHALEVVMVDISGKGRHAGTRALLLSAAFGGLVGAMPPPNFLPSANQYLLRQHWPEGFATAIHVAVDLRTGQYEVRNAGHPAAAHYHAGSGEWELLDAFGGPALGIIDYAEFDVTRRQLRPGDALMLYTDGMVETPGRDLDMGVDRLVGRATGLVAAGTFARGADLIVDTITAQDDDDRTLLFLWRDGR